MPPRSELQCFGFGSQMLGKEAVKYLEYVECYPEGYRSGVKIAKECDEINIQGFPTWVINGQVINTVSISVSWHTDSAIIITDRSLLSEFRALAKFC